jgi:hypothetical protein
MIKFRLEYRNFQNRVPGHLNVQKRNSFKIKISLNQQKWLSF